MRDSRDALLLAALWAVVAGVIFATTGNTIFRTLACVPLALYGTGFATLRALRPPVASALEWHALAVANSIAVLIGGGFLLNTIGQLDGPGWTAWISCWTLLGLGIAAIRPGGSVVLRPPAQRVAIGPLGWAGGAAAVLVLTAAAGIALDDARHWREFPATEFWMVPDGSTNTGLVSIGIRNTEVTRMRYDLEVAADGMPIAGWRAVTLEPGESFVRDLPVNRRFTRLEGRLFTSDDPGQIYRKVWLTWR